MKLLRFVGPVTVVLAALPFATSQDAVNARPATATPQPAASSVPTGASRTPDPLFDLPPLDKKGASLMGGVVQSVDLVRDHLTLRLFGGGKQDIVFDPRTEFVRNGQKSDMPFLRPGERIHVETVLRGTQVFAKRVYLPADTSQGEVSGQVIDYDAAAGRLIIRDELSSQPVRFAVPSRAAAANLLPGTLAQVRFQPSPKGPVVSDIKVLAAPGAIFTFAGSVTYLDPESRELVIANANDNKKYQIRFNPAQVEPRDRLREGVYASISAKFNGDGYVAESVTVLPQKPQ
jgi:hypothetical protein